MNLYLTVEGRFVGTQAEAKKAGKGWAAVIVPTDKDGLLAYLNDRPAGPPQAAAEELEAAPAPIVAQAPPPRAERPAQRLSWTAHEIESFVLHEASVAQVENIFACLGTRFAEQAKRAAA